MRTIPQSRRTAAGRSQAARPQAQPRNETATARRNRHRATNGREDTPQGVTFSRTPLSALPEFLRVEEAAEIARVSRSVIYAMCQEGRLHSVKFGRLLRIPREALAALANGDAGSEKR